MKSIGPGPAPPARDWTCPSCGSRGFTERHERRALDLPGLLLVRRTCMECRVESAAGFVPSHEAPASSELEDRLDLGPGLGVPRGAVL